MHFIVFFIFGWDYDIFELWRHSPYVAERISVEILPDIYHSAFLCIFDYMLTALLSFDPRKNRMKRT